MDLSRHKSRHPGLAFRRGLDGVTCAEIIPFCMRNNAICIFSHDNITWLIMSPEGGTYSFCSC